MMHKIFNLHVLHLFLICPLYCFELKKNFTFYNDPIDIVIPCHPKDSKQALFAIRLIKKNVKNLNRVIIVSSQQFTNEAEWISEDDFPFSKWDIALEIYKGDQQKANTFLNNPRSRIGWILQQLIKLYAPITIPQISSNVLVVDADVHFFRPLTFTDPKTNAGLLTAAFEYHKPYFEHASRLLPGFKRIQGCSGIAHHMLFQRSIITDLFNTIRYIHNVEPWKAICRCIDLQYVYYSSFSEYEIYFNFALARSDKIKIRNLNWKNIYSTLTKLSTQYYTRISNEYDYIAYHIFN